MKKHLNFLVVALLLLAGCKSRTYSVNTTANPTFKPNTAFSSYEDISLPRFDSLKMKYQTDTIFHGEQDEFKRILLLRNWIRSKVPINDFGDPYPGNDHPALIVDAAARGRGFHCGHYMVVQNAFMNAYGYVTRCLGSGPGVKDSADGHHGMNEVWVNKFAKWVLSDAKFNHHFEKNGVPLSALEVREEFLKNKAADITIVKGPDRTPIETDSLKDVKGRYIKHDKQWFAQWYTWLEWDQSSDRFSAWPDFHTKLNMYRDDYFKNNTWYWDGKPHWAYKTNDVNFQEHRDAIEWTPNTIDAETKIEEGVAKFRLKSATPNFKEFQMKRGVDGKWLKCDSVVDVVLSEPAKTYYFRTVNVAGVTGPEYRIGIVAR